MMYRYFPAQRNKTLRRVVFLRATAIMAAVNYCLLGGRIRQVAGVTIDARRDTTGYDKRSDRRLVRPLRPSHRDRVVRWHEVHQLRGAGDCAVGLREPVH